MCQALPFAAGLYGSAGLRCREGCDGEDGAAESEGACGFIYRIAVQ